MPRRARPHHPLSSPRPTLPEWAFLALVTLVGAVADADAFGLVASPTCRYRVRVYSLGGRS